jgi:ketol-acid reductoisomerase
MKIIYDNEISLDPLLKKRIVILGYGSQGRAQALNLKESGCDVVVGLRKRSPSFSLAGKDGLLALPIEEALRGRELISFLLPDEFHREVYSKYVEKILKPKDSTMSLVFAHGLNITFKKIIPPEFVNVFMIAPKGPGPRLREAFLQKDGIPSLLAIAQDPSKSSRELALAYAKGIGCSRRGIFVATFEEETISDLFGEQTVLCGGVIELMKAAYETMVENGISQEAAYFESFHELKFIVDLLHFKGIAGMADAISKTAHYGGMTRGKRLIDDQVKRELRAIFKEVKSGKFAKEWLDENKKGGVSYRRLSKESQSHAIEKCGARVRKEIGYS